MEFTEDQISRYSRHILLPEVGGKGQKKIAKAKILLVGAGGLGSPAALYLAAAGVGTIGLIDSDVVDLTNLQRQILHHTSDVGRPKVVSGKEKIQALNPDVQVSMYEERLTAGNAMKIIGDYDIVIDGVDNFTAKFLINDACFFAGKPLAHGGILRFDGRVTTIVPKQSPCYRCIFKTPPPPGLVASCQAAGVMGVVGGPLARLPGGWCDGCVGRYHWHNPSHGGLEAYSGNRSSSYEPVPGFRCAQDSVQRNQSETQSRLRALRGAPDDYRTVR